MVNSGKTSAAQSALLLGAMIAGILVENRTSGYRFPRLRFNIAQGIIGWLVANALTPENFTSD
jgi:uncharacterized membrane protein AbrB (regulator of aidB expression)